MSQNNPTGGSTSGKGTNTPRATGGAGTGDTDAGTTRAAGAGSGSSTGSGTSTGGGQSLTPTTGTTGGSGGTGAGTATGLAAQAKEYGQKVAEAASTAKDYVSDKMTPVVDKFKDLQNADYKEVANQAKDYARQNPGQAILISAAAGLVLGLLIRGSRR
jgi:ElaB/YqjD/DUF883 family membrane-anchored ribosome-binding protein